MGSWGSGNFQVRTLSLLRSRYIMEQEWRYWIALATCREEGREDYHLYTCACTCVHVHMHEQSHA